MNPPPMPFETRATERLILKPDATLEITNNNGRIELTGWDRTEVAIESLTRADNRDKLGRVSVKRTPLRTGCKLEVLESYLPVDSYDYRKDGPGKAFWPALTTLVVRVPRALAVTVQSHNADIAAANLVGALDLTTFNGVLDFTLARDSDQQLTAHTFNGRLLVPEPAFIWQGERRQEARARFGRGSIRVRLDSFNGTVRVK